MIPALLLVAQIRAVSLPARGAGCVDIAAHATAGNGTSAAPWTGWDKAISWRSGVYCARVGIYRHSETVELPSRTRILGDGDGLTFFDFEPAVPGLAAFEFTGWQSEFEGASFASTSLLPKVMIRLRDVRTFTASHISSAQTQWTDPTFHSIGIEVHGREFVSLEHLLIAADLPVDIEGNPAWPSLTFDHSHVSNSCLIANGPNPNILIGQEAPLSNSSFRDVSMNLGAHGFRMVNTGAVVASFAITLDNLRWEQEQAPGWMVTISSNQQVQAVRIVNVYGGSAANGVQLHNVRWGSLDQVSYVGHAYALDADNTNGALTVTGGFRFPDSKVNLGAEISATGHFINP